MCLWILQPVSKPGLTKTQRAKLLFLTKKKHNKHIQLVLIVLHEMTLITTLIVDNIYLKKINSWIFSCLLLSRTLSSLCVLSARLMDKIALSQTEHLVSQFDDSPTGILTCPIPPVVSTWLNTGTCFCPAIPGYLRSEQLKAHSLSVFTISSNQLFR